MHLVEAGSLRLHASVIFHTLHTPCEDASVWLHVWMSAYPSSPLNALLRYSFFACALTAKCPHPLCRMVSELVVGFRQPRSLRFRRATRVHPYVDTVLGLYKYRASCHDKTCTRGWSPPSVLTHSGLLLFSIVCEIIHCTFQSMPCAYALPISEKSPKGCRVGATPRGARSSRPNAFNSRHPNAGFV